MILQDQVTAKIIKKGRDMATTINYDKYSTMTINQLVSALTNAKKKRLELRKKQSKN